MEKSLSSSIQLIVGLANPGKEYEDTRHNAGAWLIKELAQHAAVNLKHESKLHAWHATVHTSHTYHLVIPTSYMNQSGLTVSTCLKYYKIPLTSLLVVHDDLDLPVGSIKLKFDGGDGGHNGLKDIIRHVHSKQFYRCRVGVGRPSHQRDVVDYVLSSPSRSDRQTIQQSLFKITDLLPLLLKGQIQQAMQTLHTET